MKKKPSLRFTIIAIAGPLIFAFMLGFLLVARLSLTDILEEVEELYIQRRADAVSGLMQNTGELTRLTVANIASWPDTQAFVRDGNGGAYFYDHWSDGSSLAMAGYSFIIVRDSGGDFSYTDFNDSRGSRGNMMPGGLPQHLWETAGQPLAQALASSGTLPDESNSFFGGVFFYNDQPYYAAGTLSDPAGSLGQMGMIAVGMRLDEAYLRSMTNSYDARFDVSPSYSALSSVAPAPVRNDQNSVSAQVVLPGMTPLATQERSFAILTITLPRDMFLGGIGGANRMAAILLLVTSVVILLIYLIFTKKLLQPVERLSGDLASNDIYFEIDAQQYSPTREFLTLCDGIEQMRENMRESSVSVGVFENILDGIDVLILVTDPETDEILFVNEKTTKEFGPREQLMGRHCWEVFAENQACRCPECPVQRLMESPDNSLVLEGYDKILRRYYSYSHAIIQWAGARRAHLQTFVDITEMRSAQQQLQKRLDQQALMSAISQSFLSAQDMDVLVTNALRMTGEFLGAGKVVIADITWDEMSCGYRFGWNNEALGVPAPNRAVMPFAPGNPMYDYFHIQNLPYISCTNVEEDPRFSYLLEFGVKAILMLPIYVDGRLWGIINIDNCSMCYDWTDSDIALMKLISSVISGAISRKNIEIQLIEAKERAEEMSRAKSDFLSRMSHEMRTPMNAIIGMTAIAKSTDDPERKEYCLDKVGSASKHLLGVINDILDMSKIESGKFELSPSEFDFEKMLIRVIGVTGFRADEKEQSIMVKVSPDIPKTIIGDDQRFSQVITNLMSNAVKFTPDGGNIMLEAAVDEADGDDYTLRVTVTDTGIGISPQQQQRLFNSFEQADNSISRKFGGTGLGLAISKNIVDLMGGTLWVESELGQGSSFIFTAKVKRGKSAGKCLLSGVSWADLHVLAVDDSLEVLDYFTSVAHSLGLNCVTASSGFEACRILEEHPRGYFNIVFADCRMPGMDGIELTRRIKNEYDQGTVVVMISSADWDAMEADARAAGVDKHLLKPLFPSLIANCINECIGISPAREDAEDEADETAEGIYFGRRILLAEDIDINREIVCAVLEPTGLVIDSAENGIQAVELFRRAPDDYELIFMDIHMPDMDGFEATRNIRALDDVPQAATVPIIAMTANVFKEDIEKCFSVGMNGHIGKPLDTAELFRTLKKYLLSDGAKAVPNA